MNDLSTFINGEVFAGGSQQLLKTFLEIGFSWRFLIVILIVLSIKYGWNLTKIHGIVFFKKKFKFYKKIAIIIQPVQYDIQNIIYGLIGMLFSWTIVNFFLTVLPLGIYKILWLDSYKEIILLDQQIEFAKLINQSMSYFGIIEVIFVFTAFSMLACSFSGGIFKTAAKLTGSLAIILYTGSIFISSYATLVLAIANKN